MPPLGILSSAGGELLRIANVHEFGCTIMPKSAKNLAIPLKPSCRNKSPSDFQNTWILDNGENRFIVRDKGKDEIDFLFLLVPKVTIPERSFIRAGYDANKNELTDVCDKAIVKVLRGELDAAGACEYIGIEARRIIQDYMITTQPKSKITLASAPNKTLPLLQGGRLREAVNYEVRGL